MAWRSPTRASGGPEVTGGFPANDTPLTLPSGTVVRVRNLVVFRGHSGSTLTIMIETPSPAADSGRVAQEALELARLHDEFADKQAIGRIVVAVCRTQACLETRERPSEMFQFIRRTDRTWVPDPGTSR